MMWMTLHAAMPEIFLAIWLMVLLMVGAFSKEEKSYSIVHKLSALGLVVAFIMMLVFQPAGAVHTAFSGDYGVKGVANFDGSAFYMVDDFSFFTKSLVLLAAVGSLFLSADFLSRHKLQRFEYPVLMTAATLGMMLMLSANDLMMLYIGLEIMSFSLYIMAAYQTLNMKSSEAGLKYFVLGSLASGVLLYGLSLLYGMAGSTSFESISAALPNLISEPLAALALVLVVVGLAFKISAAPFHMWTPDVYQGSPTPVTAFMATAPKVAAFGLLIRVIYLALDAFTVDISQMLMVLSILTMAVGSFMAIVQDDIKRLLAYSSIGHVGFMLVGLVAGTPDAIAGVLFYLSVYVVMTLGLFACLLMLRQKDIYLEKLADLKGLSYSCPRISVAFLVFFFSLAGVPPLAGFFAKFYVFKPAIDAGYTWLVIVALLFSVVAAYYSLRVLKVIFFDKADEKYNPDQPTVALQIIATVSTLVIVYLGIMNADLLDATRQAVVMLFN